MLSFSIRRIIQFIATLLLMTLISFSIQRLDTSSYLNSLNFFQAWIEYLQLLLQGNFGFAHDGKPVLDYLAKALPATLELCFFSFMLALIVGIPLGIIAGVSRGNFQDKAIYSLTLIMSSVPTLGVAILFVMYFSVHLGSLPTSGRYNLLFDIPTITGFSLIDVMVSDYAEKDIAIYNIFRHLLIPMIVLSIGPTTEIIKLLRDSVAEVMTQNYIKAAATKGLSKFQIVISHVINNAIPPILPKFGIQLSAMMSLAIITEYVFNWPGIGSWLIFSLENKDYASVQAGVLVMGLIVLTFTVFFDFFCALTSPLIRKEWYVLKQ